MLITLFEAGRITLDAFTAAVSVAPFPPRAEDRAATKFEEISDVIEDPLGNPKNVPRQAEIRNYVLPADYAIEFLERVIGAGAITIKRAENDQWVKVDPFDFKGGHTVRLFFCDPDGDFKQDPIVTRHKNDRVSQAELEECLANELHTTHSPRVAATSSEPVAIGAQGRPTSPRRRGLRGYAAADEALQTEMEEIIKRDKCSDSAAAAKVVNRATGGGLQESKIKRLIDGLQRRRALAAARFPLIDQSRLPCPGKTCR